MRKYIHDYGYYVAFAIALLGTVGSLYFSESLGLAPCVLCWYQRSMMYPLVLIIGVGVLRKDRNLPFFVLPLSLVGLMVAIYQNLLYFGVLAETLSPCSVSGPSCVDPRSQALGMITIPMLSLIAFAVITIIMSINLKKYE